MTKQYEVLKPVKDSVTGDMKAVGSILRIEEDEKKRLTAAEKLVDSGTLRSLDETKADEPKAEKKAKKTAKKETEDKKSE